MDASGRRILPPGDGRRIPLLEIPAVEGGDFSGAVNGDDGDVMDSLDMGLKKSYRQQKMWWYTVYTVLIYIDSDLKSSRTARNDWRTQKKGTMISDLVPGTMILFFCMFCLHDRIQMCFVVDLFWWLCCSNHFFGLCAIHLFSDVLKDIHDEDICKWPTIVTDGGSEDFLDFLGQIKGFAIFPCVKKPAWIFGIYYIKSFQVPTHWIV